MINDVAALPHGLSRGEEVLGRLLDLSHSLAPEDLGSAVAAHAAALSLSDVIVYLIDYEQRVLIPVPGGSDIHTTSLEVDTTLAGRAFRTQQVITGSAGAARRGARISGLFRGRSSCRWLLHLTFRTWLRFGRRASDRTRARKHV